MYDNKLLGKGFKKRKHKKTCYYIQDVLIVGLMHGFVTM